MDDEAYEDEDLKDEDLENEGEFDIPENEEEEENY